MMKHSLIAISFAFISISCGNQQNSEDISARKDSVDLNKESMKQKTLAKLSKTFADARNEGEAAQPPNGNIPEGMGEDGEFRDPNEPIEEQYEPSPIDKVFMAKIEAIGEKCNAIEEKFITEMEKFFEDNFTRAEAEGNLEQLDEQVFKKMEELDKAFRESYDKCVADALPAGFLAAEKKIEDACFYQLTPEDIQKEGEIASKIRLDGAAPNDVSEDQLAEIQKFWDEVQKKSEDMMNSQACKDAVAEANKLLP